MSQNMIQYHHNQWALKEQHDVVRNFCDHLYAVKSRYNALHTEHDATLSRLNGVHDRQRVVFEELKPYIPCFSDIYGPNIADMVVVDTIRTSLREAVGLTLTTLEAVVLRK